MSKQIVIHRSSQSADRLEPLLPAINNSSTTSPGRRSRSFNFREVAGGATAECAAVVCCCPCSLANLMYLTVYKLPAGLCRKALLQHRRRRLIKKGMLPHRSYRGSWDCEDPEFQINPISYDMSPASDRLIKSFGSDKEVIQLEKEMWDKFYGSGFWRSPSQRSQVEIIEI